MKPENLSENLRRTPSVHTRQLSLTLVVLTVTTFLGAVVQAQALPEDGACTLISGASLVTMDGPQEVVPIADQDVLVCGQKIRVVGKVTGNSIGENASVEIPEGTKRIDAAGKFLLPGLVDGHVHLFAPLDLELNLAWGVTGVRNLFGNPMSLALRKQTASGKMWGPRIWTAGPIVDGDPAIWPGSAAVATADAARKAVEEHVKAGYDFVKVYSLLKPEPFFAAIEAAKKAGVRAGGHVPLRVSLKDAVEGGMSFIEHLTGFLPALQGKESPWSSLSYEDMAKTSYSERGRLQTEGFDPAGLPEVAGWMVQHKVWNTPTFVVLERLSASAEQKKEWLASHPQMRTVSPATLSFWNPENDFRLQSVTPEQLASQQRTAKLHYPIVKALHDAGAELMLGTDTPNPFVFPGYSVHEELQRFVAAGFTPWEALRAATVQPARFLGQEDVFGRIVEGLDADLLLLDGNPLEDITNTTGIVGVMSRGRWLDRPALDETLKALAKAYGNE